MDGQTRIVTRVTSYTRTDERGRPPAPGVRKCGWDRRDGEAGDDANANADGPIPVVPGRNDTHYGIRTERAFPLRLQQRRPLGPRRGPFFGLCI